MSNILKKKDVLSFFIVVMFSIILATILKIFLIASFKVPTGSMHPTLESGDYILVNKCILGTRIYKNTGFIKDNNIKIKRLKGMRHIKRNDVLVFNNPYLNDRNKLNIFFIKRCVAVAGDTFSIVDGIYHVKNCDDTIGFYTQQQLLSKKSERDFLIDYYHAFPINSKHYQWTIMNFGPLYLPRKNDLVKIDTINIDLYKTLIEHETGTAIKIIKGRIMLDDKTINEYQFKNNYYFMAGDQVVNSQDSRHWGLLPEDYVVGKASVIWISKEPKTKKIRWRRLLKKVS